MNSYEKHLIFRLETVTNYDNIKNVSAIIKLHL
ncbi:hypothetical protein M2109_003276 [Paenibacillus sp. PastH-3]|jgi:hypothetical protein|nr:hypothetical protein [Paenibacillus sp. PastH-4]MDH6445065.1 hypothetical protein [Paenibacillus sp. PastF-4]MDH6528958.1 hypothetical protein [Paenibacillus sp. PastH-3]